MRNPVCNATHPTHGVLTASGTMGGVWHGASEASPKSGREAALHLARMASFLSGRGNGQAAFGAECDTSILAGNDACDAPPVTASDNTRYVCMANPEPCHAT